MKDREVYYAEAVDVLAQWHHEGVVYVDVDVRQEPSVYWGPLDDIALRVLGDYTLPAEFDAPIWNRFAVDFNKRVRNGKLDLDWMLGPHAVTLFKAKLARMDQP